MSFLIGQSSPVLLHEIRNRQLVVSAPSFLAGTAGWNPLHQPVGLAEWQLCPDVQTHNGSRAAQTTDDCPLSLPTRHNVQAGACWLLQAYCDTLNSYLSILSRPPTPPPSRRRHTMLRSTLSRSAWRTGRHQAARNASRAFSATAQRPAEVELTIGMSPSRPPPHD